MQLLGFKDLCGSFLLLNSSFRRSSYDTARTLVGPESGSWPSLLKEAVQQSAKLCFHPSLTSVREPVEESSGSFVMSVRRMGGSAALSGLADLPVPQALGETALCWLVV